MPHDGIQSLLTSLLFRIGTIRTPEPKISYFCRMKQLLPLLLCVCAAVSSCEVLDEHPYSERIDGPVAVHKQNIQKIEQYCDGNNFRFAFISDTQGAYDEMKEAIKLISSRGDIDFIVHGGDQTDFGLPKEFVWCRDILENSCLPYVTVIGNHDCLANGDATFEYIYGEPNYTFDVGCTHFVCLNTVALEYDYSHPVPDFGFLEADIAIQEARNAAATGCVTRTIVVMHSRPYDEQFNNNVAKVFGLYLSRYPGYPDNVVCLNGHNHKADISDVLDNGIIFYQVPNIAKRSFFIFTVTPESLSYETVDF